MVAMAGQSMARARSLTEFQEAFPDEAGCAAFLFERRWQGGFVCPRCGGERVAALKSRAHTYECLDCGRQTSITAGSVMHRSKLPLTVWFWAAHLMSTHSNGMSARQLADQFETILGLASHHEPASYWDIIGRANPRQGTPALRRAPRRRKTAGGMRPDGSGKVRTDGQIQTSETGQPLYVDVPGTTG